MSDQWQQQPPGPYQGQPGPPYEQGQPGPPYQQGQPGPPYRQGQPYPPGQPYSPQQGQPYPPQQGQSYPPQGQPGQPYPPGTTYPPAAGGSATYILGFVLLALVVLYDLIVVVSVRWTHVFTFTGDVDDLSNVFPLTMAPIMLATMVALALMARRVRAGLVLGVVTAFLHVVGYLVNIVLPEAMPDTTWGVVHTITRDSAGGVLAPALQVVLSLAAAVVLLLPATKQAFRRA